jgi:hypothetical protein
VLWLRRVLLILLVLLVLLRLVLLVWLRLALLVELRRVLAGGVVALGRRVSIAESFRDSWAVVFLSPGPRYLVILRLLAMGLRLESVQHNVHTVHRIQLTLPLNWSECEPLRFEFGGLRFVSLG